MPDEKMPTVPVGRSVLRPAKFAKEVSFNPDTFDQTTRADFLVNHHVKGEPSHKVDFRIPEKWYALISQILAYRTFPFNSHSAFYREAVFQFLRFCVQEEPRFAGAFAPIEIAQNIACEKQTLQSMAEAKSDLEKLVTSLEQMGATATIEKHLTQFLDQVERLESEEVKAWYNQYIKSRWGHYLSTP